MAKHRNGDEDPNDMSDEALDKLWEEVVGDEDPEEDNG